MELRDAGALDQHSAERSKREWTDTVAPLGARSLVGRLVSVMRQHGGTMAKSEILCTYSVMGQLIRYMFQDLIYGCVVGPIMESPILGCEQGIGCYGGETQSYVMNACYGR